MPQVKLEIQPLLCIEKAVITSDQRHSIRALLCFQVSHGISYVWKFRYGYEWKPCIALCETGFPIFGQIAENHQGCGVITHWLHRWLSLCQSYVIDRFSSHQWTCPRSKKSQEKEASSQELQLRLHAMFKSFRVSYVAPPCNVNRNHNSYKMPQRPQFNMQQARQSANMVPQMMQPHLPVNPAPGILPHFTTIPKTSPAIQLVFQDHYTSGSTC